MKQRKRRLKIQLKGKQYAISDSCLYRLKTKKKLVELLNTTLPTLKALVADTNYNCYMDKKGKKPREIQHPFIELDKVHTRIASLLCRIAQPDYIHSGIKGRSHITNATEHIGYHRVLVSDIQSFYPSTTRRMVFDFFYKKMECSSDVSDLLSKLCTYKDHIPTGSRISMPLAFWANEPMFGLLHRMAIANDVTFTVFVDDIVFSGNSIDCTFIYNVKSLIANHGHTAHPNKTKFYAKDKTKLITGVAVNQHRLLVANKHRKNIFQDLAQWKATKNDHVQIDSLNERVVGRMNAQSLIDGRYKDRVRTLRLSIEKIANKQTHSYKFHKL